MFTVVKVREDLAPGDYRDPGWYQHPQGTVAYEVDVAGAPGGAEIRRRRIPGEAGMDMPGMDMPGMKPGGHTTSNERRRLRSQTGNVERRSRMRRFAFAKLIFGTVGLIVFASALANFAVAHEGHKMECNETSINAMNADIQAMRDGEAKTTAMKEMQMAEQMMAEQDMSGCETHMDNAMEATEK